MITTLIKYENNTTISFNPIDLGHSSIYQEFRNKLFTNKTTKSYGDEFIVNETHSIKVTTTNIQNLTKGYYYPYVLFTSNGKLNKIILVPETQKPIGEKYYTRINYRIYINSNKSFEKFENISLINNQLDDSYILNTIETTKNDLKHKNIYDTYIFSLFWYNDANFVILSNTSKMLLNPEKISSSELRLHFRQNFLKRSDIIKAELSVNTDQTFNVVATSDMLVEFVSSIRIDNDTEHNWIEIRPLQGETYLDFLNDIGDRNNRCDIIIRKKE